MTKTIPIGASRLESRLHSGKMLSTTPGQASTARLRYVDLAESLTDRPMRCRASEILERYFVGDHAGVLRSFCQYSGILESQFRLAADRLRVLTKAMDTFEAAQ